MLITFPSGITFSSEFDSGNLSSVQQLDTNAFKCDTHPDVNCPRAKSFFHFSITGVSSNSNLEFTFENNSNHKNLFKHDHRPVFSCSTCQTSFNRIPNKVKYASQSSTFSLTFSFLFSCPSDHTVFFAWTWPYPLSRITSLCQSLVDSAPSHLLVDCQVPMRSCEGRPINLLTITSSDQSNLIEEPISDIDFHSNLPAFPHRPIILISSRVHPGETSSSLILEGFLTFITSLDPRAKILTKLFVIKIIPCLNPDGVFRGHYRHDHVGQNLNRFFDFPSKSEHPSAYLMKILVENFKSSNGIAMFIDLHAHASKRGFFVFGNNFSDESLSGHTMLFAKILTQNSPFFDYRQCNFTVDSMTAVDRQNKSKQGSARVALYKHANIVFSFTLETHPAVPRAINRLTCLDSDVPDDVSSQYSEVYTRSINSTIVFNPRLWSDLGRDVAVSILDLFYCNPFPRTKALTNCFDAIQAEIRLSKVKKSEKKKVKKVKRSQSSESLSSVDSSSSVENDDVDGQNSDSDGELVPVNVLESPNQSILIEHISRVYSNVWTNARTLGVLNFGKYFSQNCRVLRYPPFCYNENLSKFLPQNFKLNNINRNFKSSRVMNLPITIPSPSIRKSNQI
ncbi:hypothetical protein RCL1_006100 [Eukaryota sp. TZLM3-RCL]